MRNSPDSPANRLDWLAAALQRHSWIKVPLSLVVGATRPRFSAGVVGVVLNPSGEVLVVKHVFHPEFPWGLPGGWLDRNESPEVALKRELMEECSLSVILDEPLLITNGVFYRNHLDIAYLCHTTDEVKSLSFELLDFRWSSLNDMPPLAQFHKQAVDAAKRLQEE